MNIKFIPTGIVFNLPEDICKDLIASDRSNYEIVKEIKEKKPVANNAMTQKKNSASKPNQKVKTIEIKGESTQKPKSESVKGEA